MVTKKKQSGRKSIYSDELAQKICEKIESGQSLRSICREDGMPEMQTLYYWLAKKDHPFLEQYTRAREIQADLLAEEIIEIADEDYTAEEAQRAKIRIDARKWWAGKVRPKVYGATGASVNVNNTNVVLEKQRTKEEDKEFVALFNSAKRGMKPLNGDGIGNGTH